jgi:spore coat protein A, manganese oxidase
MDAITRRQLLRYGAGAGAVLVLPWRFVPAARGAVPPGFATPTLPGTEIDKFVRPLVIPPAMPRTSTPRAPRSIDYYEIAVRQFRQQILPAEHPQTTVWSYGSVNHPGTFHYPAFTIESRWRQATRVKWINDLVDSEGDFLSHLLPVDPTLHWANPPGGTEGRDMRPEFSATPGAYGGPVPIVTHLHGGERTPQESDGFAEAWYLPNARNIPPEHATVGSHYDAFKALSPLGRAWAPGTAVFEYPNDQRATTLWYHDHTLGMTRVNVYAGPAGFYLLRGGPDDRQGAILPGPAPQLGDRPGTRYYEIPIAIQDRSFNDDGSLFYPDSREFFDGFEGPYIGDGEAEIPPIWNPEFFGDAMVVNGRTWPFLEVEQRRYRFRLLNGCNSRFLILKLDNDLPFWQIGTEGGFLPRAVELDRLLLAPAERADVIVDFTRVPAGTEIVLRNLGPDEPFGGGVPRVDFPVAHPATTGQVLKLRVVPAVGVDTSLPPDKLVLPRIRPLPEAEVTRRLSLNEVVDEDDRPVEALLGTMQGSAAVPLHWDDEITENPEVGATEVWELHNFTADAHPIHIHEVQFQVVDREPVAGGPARPPEPWEAGFKDTVIAYPDEITRVRSTFHVPGLFVWHCHIVEHEDNEMMRPYRVGPMP